jgi:hypothetical protein
VRTRIHRQEEDNIPRCHCAGVIQALVPGTTLDQFHTGRRKNDCINIRQAIRRCVRGNNDFVPPAEGGEIRKQTCQQSSIIAYGNDDADPGHLS